MRLPDSKNQHGMKKKKILDYLFGVLAHGQNERVGLDAKLFTKHADIVDSL